MVNASNVVLLPDILTFPVKVCNEENVFEEFPFITLLDKASSLILLGNKFKLLPLDILKEPFNARDILSNPQTPLNTFVPSFKGMFVDRAPSFTPLGGRFRDAPELTVKPPPITAPPLIVAPPTILAPSLQYNFPIVLSGSKTAPFPTTIDLLNFIALSNVFSPPIVSSPVK